MIDEDFSVPDLKAEDEDFGVPDLNAGGDDFGVPDLGRANELVPSWESGDGGAATLPDGGKNQWGGNLRNEGRKPLIRRDENGKVSGYSTTKSMLVRDRDGKIAVIPTVVDGKELSQEDAVRHYAETGEHWGKADDEDSARKMARAVHDEHQKSYGKGWNDYIHEHWDEMGDEIRADAGVRGEHARRKRAKRMNELESTPGDSVAKMTRGKPAGGMSVTGGKEESGTRQVAPELFLTGDVLEDADGNKVKPGDAIAVSNVKGKTFTGEDGQSARLMEFTGVNDDGKPVFKQIDGISGAGAFLTGKLHVLDSDFDMMMGKGEGKVERSPLEQIRLGALAETGDYERYGDTMLGTATAIADRLVPYVGRVGIDRGREAIRHLANIYEGNLGEYAGNTDDEKRSVAAMDAGLEPIRKGETREDYYARIKSDAEAELRKRVMAKMEAGGKLSETEQSVLDKIVKGGVESGGYALEFALPGGAIFKGARALNWGAKAVRAATALGSAVPVVAAEAHSRYIENTTPEYGWKQKNLDDEPEFGMIAAPDSEGEAALKAIGGAVFDTAVETGLEAATMGLLRLAGKPAGWALGKLTPRAVKDMGAKRFSKFMASETGQALRSINRAYHDFAAKTQINSPLGEFAEENVQALEKVLGLEGKSSEHKGFGAEWNEFKDKQLNWQTQLDIFYGLVAQLAIGSAQSTAEGIAEHMSTADVRRDWRTALKRSAISDKTIATLTPKQQKTLDHMWRHYSANPEELKAKVKNLGLSMNLAVDELLSREGVEMVRSLEQRGITPEKFTIQTDVDGKPAFQRMVRYTADGKSAPMNAMVDADHGVTIVDQGDGTYYVMNDWRGLDAIPAYSFEEAQKKADNEVMDNQRKDADNRNKEPYARAIVNDLYSGRKFEFVPSEAALRWKIASALSQRDGNGIWGITSADQVFNADGSLKQAGAKGLHAPDGTSVIILDNVGSPADMERVLAHEATGHEGVESQTGRGAKTVDFIRSAQAEGFSRHVADEFARYVKKLTDKGIPEEVAVESARQQMSTDTYAKEAMARYAQGRLHQPTWFERKQHEANERKRAAGEDVPFDQADMEVMLAEAEAEGRKPGGSANTNTGDSGVRYFEPEEGETNETGPGADEAQPQPEPGAAEPAGAEAPRPAETGEPPAKDAGVVKRVSDVKPGEFFTYNGKEYYKNKDGEIVTVDVGDDGKIVEKPVMRHFTGNEVLDAERDAWHSATVKPQDAGVVDGKGDGVGDISSADVSNFNARELLLTAKALGVAGHRDAAEKLLRDNIGKMTGQFKDLADDLLSRIAHDREVDTEAFLPDSDGYSEAEALKAAYVLASAQDYEAAETLLKNHSSAASTPLGIDLLARIKFEQGDEAGARRLWESVLRDHPNSSTAESAKKALAAMDAENKPKPKAEAPEKPAEAPQSSNPAVSKELEPTFGKFMSVMDGMGYGDSYRPNVGGELPDKVTRKWMKRELDNYIEMAQEEGEPLWEDVFGENKVPATVKAYKEAVALSKKLGAEIEKPNVEPPAPEPAKTAPASAPKKAEATTPPKPEKPVEGRKSSDTAAPLTGARGAAAKVFPQGTNEAQINRFVESEFMPLSEVASAKLDKDGTLTIVGKSKNGTHKEQRIFKDGSAQGGVVEDGKKPAAPVRESRTTEKSSQVAASRQPSIKMKNEAAEKIAQKQEDDLAALFDTPELGADEQGASPLETDSKRFDEELQLQIDGKLPEGHVYQIGRPGAILRSTGVPDLPMQLSAMRLKEKSLHKRHPFELGDVKGLVKALQTPVAVFSYGDSSKAQNIIVEISSNGKNFLVGLSLNPEVGGRALNVNSIRNVFPKDTAEWLHWIEQGKLLYADKQKVQDLIDQQRMTFADVAYLDLNRVNSILNSFVNPQAENLQSAGVDFDTSELDANQRYLAWAKKWKLDPSKKRNQREWASRNGVSFDTKTFDPDMFQKRVGAVAKLVKTYQDNGVADFNTLATRMAERFPEKFDAMKPYLRGVWNAVADQMGLTDISRGEAEKVYGTIEAKAKEAANGPGDNRADGGVRAPADGGERPGGVLAGGRVRSENPDERVGSVGAGAVSGLGNGLAETQAAGEGASGAGEASEGAVPVADSAGHGERERDAGGDSSGNGSEPAAGVKKPAEKAADSTKVNPIRRDFVMTKAVEDAILEKRTADRVRNNIAAIKLIRELAKRDYAATPAEQETLAKFVGWGGLREAVFNYDLERAYDAERSGDASMAKEILRRRNISQNLYDLHKELRSILNDKEYDSAKRSSSTAFYTPVGFVRALHDAFRSLGVKGGRFLGPSAGTGNFASAAGQYEKPVNWQFVEKDAMTGEILKALFPNQRVTIGGFEETKFPDGFFDFAIDNVPYADVPINDRSLSSKMFKIHDYFFAKTLAKLRPGGVMAFLTSTGTLDKTSPILRQFLTEHGGKIVGAVRLPNGFFSENAGTEAASDLVIVQKVDGRPDNSAFEKGVEYGFTEQWERRKGMVKKPLTYNGYFKEHPEQIVGKMEATSGQYGPRLNYAMPDGDMMDAIRQAVARAFDGIDRDALLKNATVAEQKDSAPIYDESGLRQGNVTLKDGKPFVKSGEMLVPVAMPNDQRLKKELMKRGRTGKGILSDLFALRKAMRDLIDAQMADTDTTETDLAPLQKELGDAYDAFVKKNGTLHDRWVTPFVLLDKADGNRMLALERVVKGEDGKQKVVKSDIFTKRVISRGQRASRAETPKDALVISYSESGGINVPRIAELLGVDEETAIAKLKEGGDAFENPQTGRLEPSWEYLSGRVRAKLAAARAALEAGEEGFRANVEALEKVQPPMVKLEDTEIKFGATWIEPDVMSDFMRDAFGSDRMQVKFVKNEATGQWEIPRASGSVANNESPWGETSWDPLTFVLRVLNHGSMNHIVTDPVTKKKYLDERKTEANKLAAEKMHQAFAEFIMSSDKWAEPMYERYNAVMTDMVEIKLPNNVLPFRSSGMSESAMNKLFEGGDPAKPKKGREYQSAVIARGVLGGSSLCLAHCVGAGKTLEMQSIGMMGRRLGMFKKPMYVVPNHMLEQFVNEFVDAFPNANILKMSEDDVKPENRRAFFAQVANGDWDAIVVKRSTFSKKLAMSTEYQKNYLKAQIDDMAMVIEAMQSDGNGVSVDKANKIREKLQAKLEHLVNAENHDSEIVPFEELGIDQLFIDEAHNFKGLPIVTSQGRTGGLSQGDSQQAIDMQMKTEYVQSLHGGNRGVLFATGTPLSNAPVVESYVILKYLAPNRLKEQGLEHFDDFVGAFGRITTESEFSLDGKTVKERDKVSAFVNIPELMRLFKSVVDIVNPDQLDIPRPKPKYHMIDVDMTPTQARIMEMVADWASMPPDREDRNRYLDLTRIAKNACLTPRLIGFADGGNKVIRAVSEIKRVYDETSGNRGAQLVFTDMFNLSEKTSRNAFGRLNYLGFTDERPAPEMLPQGQDYNLNEEVRDLLVQAGIPKDEIAIIQDIDKSKGDKDANKSALFAKVRSGEVRVLIGSRPKMGEGTNVQERLAAIHLLHPGWKPAEDEQAIGRIIRFGNTYKEGQIFYYLTKGNSKVGSYETKNHQIVGVKGRLIDQVMHGDGTIRVIEMDENAMDRDMLMGLASGNKALMELIDVNKRVHKLELNTESTASSARRLKMKAEATERDLDRRVKEFEKTRKGIDRWNEANKDKPFAITTPDGRTIEKVGEIAQYVSAQVSKQLTKDAYDRDETVKLGEINGIPVVATFDAYDDQKVKIAVPTLGIEREINYSGFIPDFSTGAMTAFKKSILDIVDPSYAEEFDARIEDLRKQTKKMSADAARLQKDFDSMSKELATLRSRQAQLEREVAPLVVQTVKDRKVAQYGSWFIEKSGGGYSAIREKDGKELRAATVKELIPLMDAEDFARPGMAATKTRDLTKHLKPDSKGNYPGTFEVPVEKVNFDTLELQSQPGSDRLRAGEKTRQIRSIAKALRRIEGLRAGRENSGKTSEKPGEASRNTVEVRPREQDRQNGQTDAVFGAAKIEFRTKSKKSLAVSKGTASLAEVRNLFDRLNADTDTALLADKVFTVCGKLDTDFYFTEFSEDEIADGVLGVEMSGTVMYSVQGFSDPDVTAQEKAHILLHEAIHSVTSYAIDIVNGQSRAFANIPISQELRDAVAELETVYSETEHFLARRGKTSYAQTAILPGYVLENIDDDFEVQRATKHLHMAEFMAELSNADVRKELQKHTLWSRIVNGVRKIITAFERLFGDGNAKTDREENALAVSYRVLDKFLRNADGGAVLAANRLVFENGENPYFDKSKRTAGLQGDEITSRIGGVVNFDTLELTPAEAEYAASDDKTPTEKVMREVYGMTNDEIATALRAAGMEPPPHVRKPDEVKWQQAEALLSNPTYMAKLSQAVARFPRPLQDYEIDALEVLFRQREARVNRLKEVYDELAAIPKDDLQETPELAEELKDAAADLTRAKALMGETGKANILGAGKVGSALRAKRGSLYKDDLTYAGITNEIAQQVGGAERITPEMDAKIREIAKLFEGMDEQSLRIATERLKPLAEKVIKQTKDGLKARKVTERKAGDEAKRVMRNYEDALNQIEVGAAEVGGTLIGLSDQQYPSWGRWLKAIGEFHCFENPDITEEECIDAIVKDVSPFMDGVDANQVRDALTGFGHNFKQSRYEAQRLMNDLKAQARLKRQLDWMDEKNTMPPLTGLIRDEPSDTTRNLQKQVAERKKEVPDAGRDERRLKSALDAAKKRVQNRIADLTRAIETGEKIPASQRKVVDDIELRDLKRQKEELQKQYDDLFGTERTMTDAQRIALTEKLLAKELERALADLDRARSGDFSKRPQRPGVESPTIDVLRDKIAQTREQIRELKKAKYEFGMTPEEVAALNARKMAAREKAMARLAERVATGDLRPQKKPQPPMPPDMQKRYDELGEQMKRGRQKLAELSLEAENATVPTFWRKAGNFLRFVTTAQRALRATMDFSAVLRQAARMTLAHPVKAARAFGKAWTAARSEASLQDVNEEILSDPTVREAVDKYGLHLREVDATNARDVEMFHGMERNRIKMFGKEFAITDIPFFGEFMLKSERHYLTYLNTMSAELYTSIVNDNKRFPGGATPWQKKMVADMINIWNGSAALSKERRQALQKAWVNDVFWAPQLAISRVQSAVGYDWWHPLVAKGLKNADGGYDKPTNAERKAAAKVGLSEHLKSTIAMLALGGLLKWMFSDDDDKFNFSQADWFEKLMMLVSPKIGNTTIDLTGGESTFDKLVHQVATKSKRTGTGRLQKLGEYNAPSVMGVVGRYLQGKLSPSVSTVTALWEGKDFVGDEFTPGKVVQEMLVPLTFEDVKDQIVQNGVGKSLVTVPLTLLGAGGSTYDRKPYENAVNHFLEEKRAYDAISKDAELTQSERKELLDGMKSESPLMADSVRGEIDARIKAVSRLERKAKDIEKKGGTPTASLTVEIERQKSILLDKIRRSRRK